MIQYELLVSALLTFAEGHDASTDGGHMLADGEGDALHKRRLDSASRRPPAPAGSPPAYHIRLEALRGLDVHFVNPVPVCFGRDNG